MHATAFVAMTWDGSVRGPAREVEEQGVDVKKKCFKRTVVVLHLLRLHSCLSQYCAENTILAFWICCSPSYQTRPAEKEDLIANEEVFERSSSLIIFVLYIVEDGLSILNHLGGNERLK